MSVKTCRPRRALRAKRGIFTIGLSIATAVGLVALLTPEPGKDVDPMSGLDPGSLSANHSHLASQCYRCHSDASLSPTAMLDIHGSAAHHRSIEDGKLCLSCHDTIGGKNGAYAFSAHTAEEISQDSSDGSGKSRKLMMLTASGLASSRLTEGEIHCATCHKEHHGEEFNITTLTNQQCQICHQNQFESFSNGHPEFVKSNYPYTRRTGIRFDHYSHYQTHFSEELKNKLENVPAGYDPAALHSESVSCASCHSTGKKGEPMAVKSFEAACASCHGGDTRAGKPLAFLAFPPINKAALNERLATSDNPRSIGTWIAEPADNFPWPTLQLLSGEAREAWTRLHAAGINPFDSGSTVGESKANLADMETVLWAVKELARDLSQNQPHENPSKKIGHDELVRRLADAGFQDPEALVKGFPPGAFDAMRQGFSKKDYIRLLSEVSAKRKGTYPAVEVKEAPTPTEAPAADTTGSVSENFDGDTGEDFGGEKEENFEPAPEEDFGENKAENFDGGGESFGTEEEFGTEEPAKEEATEEPAELEVIDPVLWAARGGWYQQYGALYYRSTGHADPLIRSWLDQLAAKVDSPLFRAQFNEGFDFRSGIESTSSGSCLKCHAVEEIRNESGLLSGARIRWNSTGESPGETLTRYDHATHLLLTDCRTCHATETDKPGFITSFPEAADWDESSNWSTKADPFKFISNFKAIRKQTCADCHQADKAGDGCIQCHIYHKDFAEAAPDHAISR